MSSLIVRILPYCCMLGAAALPFSPAVAETQVPVGKAITKISTYESNKYIVLEIDPPLSGSETGEHCTESAKVLIKDVKHPARRDDDDEKERKDADNKGLLMAATVAYMSSKQVGFGLYGCSAAGDARTSTMPVIYRLDY